MKTLRFMIVAGEASGDGHAAKLVRAIRDGSPDNKIEFFGSAGPRMREAGVTATVEADSLSIVGLAEIGRALPMFLMTMRKLKAAAAKNQPDVAILIDFPDFNLKLAKHLKKQGIRVVYYISPQLWAWRKYRISSVKKYVDLMLTILPFEKDWYDEHGVSHVEYVGSPLAREVHADRTKQQFCSDHELDAAKPIITLLPGSRHKEIVQILPVMLAAAERLASDSDIQFVIAISSAKQRKDIDQIVAGSKVNFTVVEHETYDALIASDAAAVTSGTATLETGIIGTPLVIVYKTSAINYKLLEPFIEVPHYGLINLIAGERLAKELIQGDFTPQTLADEINRLLQPEVNAEMRVRLKETADKLGHGGASKRAAEAILKIVG
ncbi:MAG TPA: lipid-A-disaccharide synthase [Pyrinomonadaceae bacterium]|nr:lipid-A-disaccharide synthase [Pyrinomonadaceae bacterium]